jgi:adenylate cyclase
MPAAHIEAMPYKLVSPNGGESYDLRTGITLVVGRGMGSDIPLQDPTISRRHAELTRTPEGLSVRDLGSSNGTFVNGTRVKSATLAPGDTVLFGNVPFRVELIATGEYRAIEGPPSVAPTGATIVRQRPVRESAGLLSGALAGGTIVSGASSHANGLELTQRKLALLLEVSKALSRVESIDVLLEQIAGYVFQIMDVDRVAILLCENDGELVPHIARDRQGSDAGRAVPRSIAGRVVSEKIAVVSDNAPEDQRFGGASIVMQSVRSAMCAPLIGMEDSVQGVLYVDNLTTTHRFDDEDLEFLVAFSGIAAVAIENGRYVARIRHEELARSNFERFFAPALAARIASAPDALRHGGEKRRVAILFSDIRGFTTLSETMPPEEVAALLSEYFTVMVECVFRHGGTLDKFIGDAIMAQWGAPVAAEDDAERALAAARDMLEALDRLNARWRSAGKPELRVGIGLNMGEVFAGYVGSERRLEYTILGDAVNVASRICAAAAGGEVLMTEGMVDSLRERPVLAERAPLGLKGKSKAVSVYALQS